MKTLATVEDSLVVVTCPECGIPGCVPAPGYLHKSGERNAYTSICTCTYCHSQFVIQKKGYQG